MTLTIETSHQLLEVFIVISKHLDRLSPIHTTSMPCNITTIYRIIDMVDSIKYFKEFSFLLLTAYDYMSLLPLYVFGTATIGV